MKKILCLFLGLASVGYAQDASEYGVYDKDVLPAEFHQSRREALRNLMPNGSVAIFFAAAPQKMSNDIFYPYHPDPNFFYLTGYNEPNAALVIFKDPFQLDSVKTNEIIYVQERKKSDEIWDGKRLGVKGAHERLLFEHVRGNGMFADIDVDLTKFSTVLLSTPSDHADDDPRNRGDLASMLKHLQILADRDEVEISKFGLKELMARLRQKKSKEEIALIKKACDITCNAHNELMRTFYPGMAEYQAQAIIEFCFAIEGAERRGFPSICGSGDNACTLHYSSNRRTAENGDLMLVDIGAEYHGYTADVTRTFPVNGKFTFEQRKLYDLVLLAHDKAVELARPGQKFQAPHDKAVAVIAAGLLRLGIIKETREVYDYYMHGTSHYMGLDVHDAGLYGEFKPNQIMTVEPGIYIPEGSPCDKKWWGIGIRIEDDVLITQYSNQVLTSASPIRPDDIEKLMKRQSQYFKTTSLGKTTAVEDNK